MSIVGMGNYLCFLDTVHLKDAYVVERRIEGYGTYENAGFLIIPSRRDTVGLWALVDRELPKPAAWEWNGLVPMTLEEYRAKLKEINALSDGLASLDVVDSILRNRSTTVQVKRLTR